MSDGAIEICVANMKQPCKLSAHVADARKVQKSSELLAK